MFLLLSHFRQPQAVYQISSKVQMYMFCIVGVTSESEFLNFYINLSCDTINLSLYTFSLTFLFCLQGKIFTLEFGNGIMENFRL